MATEFGCELDAVERAVADLATVIDQLDNFVDRVDGFEDDLWSEKISDALRGFHSKSSDQRKKILELLTGILEMLRGLADGVRQIDDAIVAKLDELELPPVTAHPVVANVRDTRVSA